MADSRRPLCRAAHLAATQLLATHGVLGRDQKPNSKDCVPDACRSFGGKLLLWKKLLLGPSLWILVIFPALSTAAEIGARADPLFVTILALDTRLFDAYNHCDLVTLGSMVSDDLEFYHDQTGLSVGKAPFLAAIKQNICGKVQRELLRNTLEVYPLKGYGAVEIGVHRFHHPGHPENVGDAKFIVLWRNEGGVWKVTRVISYEHNRGRLAK